MIAILMSTYNGERYLREQIDSLLNQTYKDWKLYIRDDGSTDDTLSIIESYERDYPEQIVYKKDDLGNLGPAASFMNLLSVIDSDYYMFCDQDDVWLPNKIEKTYGKMLDVEAGNMNKPVLIYGDLQLVDMNLRRFPYTKWEYEHSDPYSIRNIYDLFANNQYVSGCTMMINYHSKKLVLPYKKSLMHDRWISLIVYGKGGVLFPIEEPLILYRISGFNTVGIKHRNLKYYFLKLLSFRNTLSAHIASIAKLKMLPFEFNMIRYYIYVLKMISLKMFN